MSKKFADKFTLIIFATRKTKKRKFLTAFSRWFSKKIFEKITKKFGGIVKALTFALPIEKGAVLKAVDTHYQFVLKEIFSGKNENKFG